MAEQTAIPQTFNIDGEEIPVNQLRQQNNNTLGPSAIELGESPNDAYPCELAGAGVLPQFAIGDLIRICFRIDDPEASFESKWTDLPACAIDSDELPNQLVAGVKYLPAACQRIVGPPAPGWMSIDVAIAEPQDFGSGCSRRFGRASIDLPWGARAQATLSCVPDHRVRMEFLDSRVAFGGEAGRASEEEMKENENWQPGG